MQQISPESIWKALATVDDPDLKKDLVSLNMVKDVRVDGNKIFFTVVLTTPACPLKEKIRLDCEQAVRREVGEDVLIYAHLTAEVNGAGAGPLLPGVQNIIAIASGKGGVGKSTVTANLAFALAQKGAKVGIIDADIFGPSMPLMFNLENARPNVEEVDGKTWILPIEQYGIKILSIGFLAPPDAAVVWRGPMASTALRQFFSDAQWGELDYLLIDLPPGTSDIHLTMAQSVPVTGAVVVTTPQKVALADAQKAIAMFKQKQINIPILGVVENMAYFTPEELPENKYYIFGKDGGKVIAARNEVPFLGQVPLVQGIREAADKGKPIVSQEDSAESVAYHEIVGMLVRQIALLKSNAVLESAQTTVN